MSEVNVRQAEGGAWPLVESEFWVLVDGAEEARWHASATASSEKARRGIRR
jgi:hypothetical protein